MKLEDFKVNGAVAAALAGMVDSGRVPHAILFHEEDGGGAFPLCQAFLQHLYYGAPTEASDAFSLFSDAPAIIPSAGEGISSKITKLIHPDVYYIFPVLSGKLSVAYIAEFRELALRNPCFTEEQLDDACGFEGKNSLIAVAEANDLVGKLAFHALEGGWKTVVMYLPEKMNPAAANKLLKSLEEPSEKTLFLLISHAPEKLLPTIRSRCQLFRVRPEALDAPVEKEGEEVYRELFGALVDALMAKDLSAALDAGERMAGLPSRDRMKAFCRYGSGCLRKVFMLQQGLPQLAGVNEAEKAYYERLASAFKKTFPRAAMGVFDRTQTLLERNVNQKIAFTDLVNRFYTLAV